MTQEKGPRSLRQTVLSMAILSILMVIVAGVFISQFRFNPGLLQKDAFLPGPDKNKPPGELSPSPLFKPLPEGMEPLTSEETFDTGSLSDKINGKAELYLSAGFTSLVSQRFKIKGTDGLWMEAFVYDMGNRENAFSVFSTQRREGAASLELTQNAYRTSNALFLTHGRYYVEIIASKASGELPAPVKMLAGTFMGNTPSEAAALNETALFPREGLVKNSITLIASDAFGYDGFKKIYTAQYRIDDHSLMAYVSRRGTPGEAKEMAASYTAFLLAFGGKNIEAPPPVKDARLLEILGTYEIVISRGRYLAGIREAETIRPAEMLAVRLYHGLKGEGSEHGSEP